MKVAKPLASTTSTASIYRVIFMACAAVSALLCRTAAANLPEEVSKGAFVDVAPWGELVVASDGR